MKRLRAFTEALLKSQDAESHSLDAMEIARGERLTLQDREVQFDLIQPTGMNGQMNSYRMFMTGRQPRRKGGRMMRTAIIHDPEDASGGRVGWLAHDGVDQFVEGGDTVLRTHLTENQASADIQSGLIGHCPQAFVLELDLTRMAWQRWTRGMEASKHLQPALLIGAEHIVVRPQRLFLPEAMIQVKNNGGFGQKVRVAPKQPTVVTPRTQRIFLEPTTQGAGMNPADDLLSLQDEGDIVQRVPTQRLLPQRRTFTGHGFGLHHLRWGKNAADALSAGGRAEPVRLLHAAAVSESPAAN